MKSFKVKAKETEELEQVYKKLEQEWHSLKQSNNSTTSSRKYPPPSNPNIKPIQEQDIMFKLQQDSSSPTKAWKNMMMMTRNKDMAAQEILQERREAIESGKLKGRRLFQPIMVEGESDNNMVPHREVRSISFYYSEDEHDGDETSGSKLGLHDCTRECSYSSSSSLSSSSSCLVGAYVDKDQEVKGMAKIRVGRLSHGRRYAIFLGGVAIALLIIAICMSLEKSYSGHDHDMILVPT